MIDPLVGAATGAVAGMAVGEGAKPITQSIPAWGRLALFGAVVGFLVLWYFGFTHSTRQKIRRKSKRG